MAAWQLAAESVEAQGQVHETATEAVAVRVDGEGGGVTVKVSLGRGQIICSHLDSAQSNRLKFEVTFCQLPSLVVTHPCHVLPQQPPKLSTAKN